MELTHEPVRLHVATRIHQLARLGFGEAGEALTVADIYRQLVEPPNAQVGDFAFGCFLFAKTLRQPPPGVAKKIEAEFTPDHYIASAKGMGPYLNFTLTARALGEL